MVSLIVHVTLAIYGTDAVHRVFSSGLLRTAWLSWNEVALWCTAIAHLDIFFGEPGALQDKAYDS